MHLTNAELALFAELLDEYATNEELCLLRDRIETHLYLAGFYDQAVIEDVGEQYCVVSADGIPQSYGLTPLEAVQEYKRRR